MRAAKDLAVVTGWAGFIGSHMVDLPVEQGFRVHVIDSLMGGGLLNLERHRRNPDVVLEKGRPIDYMSTNALRTVVLHWSEVCRIPVNSIRIFNAYGIRLRTTCAYCVVFEVFLAHKLAGKPLTVVRAFYAAAKNKVVQRIYNSGAGNWFTFLAGKASTA